MNEGHDNSRAPSLESSWFRDAYMSAKEFYAKDDILDSKDRLELSDSYRSIARAQLTGGLVGFSAVFLPPFFLKFYKTNAIRGVNVPLNFVFGLGAMILTTQASGDYAYKKIMKGLDEQSQFQETDKYGDEIFSEAHKTPKNSKQRQYEMMALLNNGSASKWAAYFYITYTNPARRFPNPEVKMQELKNGGGQRSSFLNQRDPLGLYSGPSFDKKEGVPERVTEKQNPILSSWENVRQGSAAQESSWNKVRRGMTNEGSTLSVEDSTDRDQFALDDPFSIPENSSQSDFDTLLQKEREGKHSWD